MSSTPARYLFIAVDMASEQVRTIQTAGSTYSEKGATAAMPTDCPMLDLAGVDTQAAATLNCGCDTCELCLALASFRDTGLLSATFMPHTPPRDADSGFGNADHAPGLKPPIY